MKDDTFATKQLLNLEEIFIYFLLKYQVYSKKDPLFEFHPFLQSGIEWKTTRTELTPSYTALKVRHTMTNDHIELAY